MNADFDTSVLGLMSRPFRAKFPGTCALSGDRFFAGDEIRMTAREGQEKAVPVLTKWIKVPFYAGAKIVRTPEEILEAIQNLSGDLAKYRREGSCTPKERIYVWTKAGDDANMNIYRSTDGRLVLNGDYATEKQIMARCLKHAKCWMLQILD